MRTVTDLIDAARKALNVSSDAEFARQLGVSRGTIANWKSGYSLPDTVMCATLAGLTGLPLARVLGIVGEARAVSREEKAVWRKLAATAMGLGLVIGMALPAPAHAAAQAVHHVTASAIDSATLYTLCAVQFRPLE
ncbi:helix-turn-helix domain-containing protein [Stenotrophomonas sp. NA06056]|nr:helix-turn-helix domain-containing protein [Stenotrophomonas sp. NA06056]